MTATQNPNLPLIDMATQLRRAVADATSAIQDLRRHHLSGMSRPDVSDAQAHHDRGYLHALADAERVINQLTKEATT